LAARQADLEFKALRSPIAGTLADLQVKAGDVIQAGSPLTKVIGESELLARIDVPAIYAPQLRPGLTVQLIDPIRKTPLETGVVDSVDPGVIVASQSVLVKAAFANPKGLLRNGLRVRTKLILGTEEALAVQALLRNPPLGIKAERDITVILVTSAFHMRRASSLFEQVGLTVIPYAVDFKVPATKITPMSFLPSAGALSKTDGAVREMLGVLYYKVRHMLSY
jgi:multidrug efflux pump subunit AcrA (membrane-fusion protein)